MDVPVSQEDLEAFDRSCNAAADWLDALRCREDDLPIRLQNDLTLAVFSVWKAGRESLIKDIAE